MVDRLLIDHPPAPALLDEEPRGHGADDPVLAGAVIMSTALTVANGRRGSPWLPEIPGRRTSRPYGGPERIPGWIVSFLRPRAVRVHELSASAQAEY
jgi:hypothetical protein